MARIREIRKEMRLSQAQFGALIGVHQTAVSQWEKGRTYPDVDSLIRIARLSGQSIDAIIDHKQTGAGERDERVPLYPYRAPSVDSYRPAATCAGIPGSDFAVLMADDSMRGARILPGDTVFFISGTEIENGAVYAVDAGEGILIRRVYRLSDGKHMLAPENNAYAPELAPGDLAVLGRALCFRSML